MTEEDGKRRHSELSTVLAWVVVAVLLVGALFATIGSLNRDVYSAGGFVRQYLDALARQDTTGAMALPGVKLTDAQLEAAGLPQDLPSTLLRASVLGTLDDIRLKSDTESASGIHTVVYEFNLGGDTTKMEFTVAHTGTFAGVFDSWRFSKSPLAVLQVTVLNQATFTVNGLTLDTRAHAEADAPATFSNQAAYLAFAPALYSFEHTSTLLTAAKTKVPVTISGATDVTVDALPNDVFINQVQTELNRFLDTCTTQQVLKPSGCPFGIDINDRVRGLPIWSIAEYPPVSLGAGEAGFEMLDTVGQAHIVVEVQSLFDGEMTTRDENVEFVIGLSVAIQSNGALAIQLH